MGIRYSLSCAAIMVAISLIRSVNFQGRIDIDQGCPSDEYSALLLVAAKTNFSLKNFTAKRNDAIERKGFAITFAIPSRPGGFAVKDVYTPGSSVPKCYKPNGSLSRFCKDARSLKDAPVYK